MSDARFRGLFYRCRIGGDIDLVHPYVTLRKNEPYGPLTKTAATLIGIPQRRYKQVPYSYIEDVGPLKYDYESIELSENFKKSLWQDLRNEVAEYFRVKRKLREQQLLQRYHEQVTVQRKTPYIVRVCKNNSCEVDGVLEFHYKDIGSVSGAHGIVIKAEIDGLGEAEIECTIHVMGPELKHYKKYDDSGWLEVPLHTSEEHLYKAIFQAAFFKENKNLLVNIIYRNLNDVLTWFFREYYDSYLLAVAEGKREEIVMIPERPDLKELESEPTPNIDVGTSMYDSTLNVRKTWDGSKWITETSEELDARVF